MRKRKVDQGKLFEDIRKCRFVHQRLKLYAKAFSLIKTGKELIIQKPHSSDQILIYRAGDENYSQRDHKTYQGLLQKEVRVLKALLLSLPVKKRVRVWASYFFDTHNRIYEFSGNSIELTLDPINKHEIEEINRFYYQKVFKRLFKGSGTYKDHDFQTRKKIFLQTGQHFYKEISACKIKAKESILHKGSSFLIKWLHSGAQPVLYNRVLSYIEMMRLVYAIETFRYQHFLRTICNTGLKRVPMVKRRRRHLTCRR